jgi:translation initiation factor 5B
VEPRLRQPVVVVLGHVDAGKCVGASTQLELERGELPAARAFEAFRRGEAWEGPDYRLYRAEGLRLLSFDPLLGFSLRRATYLWKRSAELLLRLGFEDGSSVCVTPEHPFLVDLGPVRAYIPAASLRKGARVLARGKGAPRALELVSCERIRGRCYVYDFTVEGTHSFCAGGLILHNTSLLDKIRGTAVQAREAGGITQHIGASLIPSSTLRALCGPLLERYRIEVLIPGLLFIDTPGHEAFSNLRMRGGSAADIAILVVDALRGFEAQTYESLELLRQRRVPFLVALNKVDLLPGWRPKATLFITEALRAQDRFTQEKLDERIYDVVGTLSRLGLQSEAFYRIRDFTRQVSIVPVSAKTGEGIGELLALLLGLAQQYLRGRLMLSGERGRGIVLELREEEGLGHTANLILLDGLLRVGQRIVLVKREGPVVTRIRSLFMPKPLDEIRDPREKFTPVEAVSAAAGVKLVAPELEGVLAGSPFEALGEGEEAASVGNRLMEDVKSVLLESDKVGVVVKADTLGSLEALMAMLRARGVPIRRADIGPVSKRDVVEAAVVRDKDEFLGVILAFNVRALREAEEELASKGIRAFFNDVIYRLVEEYEAWAREERLRRERQELASMTQPCKLRVLEGFVFRRSDPAIFGIEVLLGRLKPKDRLMNAKGEEVGEVRQIEESGRPLAEALKGMRVAISAAGVNIGRNVKEGDVLYTLPSQDEVRLLREKYWERLDGDLRALLEEIVRLRRSAS